MSNGGMSKGGSVPGTVPQGMNAAWSPTPGQTFGANPDVGRALAEQFGYTGDFGGGQWNEWAGNNLDASQMKLAGNIEQHGGLMGANNQQDWGLAKNAGLHEQLADVFGYTGDFGNGGFINWARANLNPQQMAYMQQMEAAGGVPDEPNNWLGQGALDQLGNAVGFLTENAQSNPGNLSTTDLSPYQNPYADAVINRTMGEMNRQNDISQMGISDAAQSAGAFGGDRHGLASSEQNRNFQNQQANWLAAFNSQNFDQSMNRAQQDIANNQWNKQANMGAAGQLGNLANMGFGWDQQIQNQMGMAGQQQQALMQALIGAGQGQMSGIYGHPQAQGQFGSSNMPGLPGVGSTQSNSPGGMDYAAMAAQLAAAYMMMQCWVAREVYGETNPKWRKFRDWMIGRAPAPLFRFYSRHGERIARTVKRRPWLKLVLRPMMDAVIA